MKTPSVYHTQLYYLSIAWSASLHEVLVSTVIAGASTARTCATYVPLLYTTLTINFTGFASISLIHEAGNAFLGAPYSVIYFKLRLEEPASVTNWFC